MGVEVGLEGLMGVYVCLEGLIGGVVCPDGLNGVDAGCDGSPGWFGLIEVDEAAVVRRC